jgi:hypothetical protein
LTISCGLADKNIDAADRRPTVEHRSISLGYQMARIRDSADASERIEAAERGWAQ